MIERTAVDLLWVRSFQEFLARVVDDVGQERSVCVFLPATEDITRVRQWVRRALRDADIGIVSEIDAADLPRGDIPGSLGEHFDVTWRSRYAPRNTANLAEADGLPRIIEIAGIESLTAPDQAKWWQFLATWAQVAQGLAPRGLHPPSIVTIVDDSRLDGIPATSNVRLALRWWWGIPSAAEVRLLCRDWMGGTDHKSSVWREHLVPSLAGNEMAFAEALCELVTLPIAVLLDRLRRIALDRGWTKELLRRSGSDQIGQHLRFIGAKNGIGVVPPPNLRPLWAMGALSYTPEYAIELHTLALAILGVDSLIRHRCWRGQASLLLPAIDAARLEICRHFCEVYGSDWPVRWDAPLDWRQAEAVRADPLACELGHLKNLTSGMMPLRGSERGLADVISTLWTTRNRLAHYQTIDFSEFERFWKVLERLEL